MYLVTKRDTGLGTITHQKTSTLIMNAIKSLDSMLIYSHEAMVSNMTIVLRPLIEQTTNGQLTSILPCFEYV